MRLLFTFPVLMLLSGGWLQAGKLTFEKELLEFHLAPDATTVTADFQFQNKTDKPVTITRAEPVCSCQKVEISGGRLVYQPGEKGIVRASFELGNFSGVVDKSTLVYLSGDDEKAPSHVLNMRAHLPVLVELGEKTLLWELGAAAETRVCRIRIKEGESIKVLRATCRDDQFKVELKTITEGREYEVAVTPGSTAKPILVPIRIETDCAIERHRVQQIFGVVRKPVAKGGAPKP